MGVIFLFVDGVGLGEKTSANPFLKDDIAGFDTITDGQAFSLDTHSINRQQHLFKAIDATLDVEGLPQSGTGQTALFTGKNASKKIGKHFGPFPHSGIQSFLKEESLFHKAKELNKTCSFVNAYPDIFFQKVAEKNRWSCTTLMAKSAEVQLNTEDEVKKERALTAELTQQAWREQLNIPIPEITPEQAADRLLQQAVNFDLILHEYYLTDKAGHSQEMHQAQQLLGIYGRFLKTMIERKPKEVTLVLCSDHGNIEDLATKTHTLNPVPLFVHGPGAPLFSQVQSIMGITPSILETLKKGA